MGGWGVVSDTHTSIASFVNSALLAKGNLRRVVEPSGSFARLRIHGQASDSTARERPCSLLLCSYWSISCIVNDKKQHILFLAALLSGIKIRNEWIFVSAYSFIRDR